MDDRIKKVKINSLVGLINQFIVLVCGFILPRMILTHYGSEVNGLVSSITEFLSLISLLELGVGAVVRSAWYKPLAEKNNELINAIYVSSSRFFKKIGCIFIVYVIVLFFLYPVIISNSFGFDFVIALIVAVAVTQFAQYFFGITNQLLIGADQKAYISIGIQMITTIVNTIVSIVLMNVGVSIQGVKASTAVIYLIRPLLMEMYVKKNYKIDKKVKLTDEPIKQKWNGMAQHIAAMVLNNTDITVLTLFSSLGSVSIYSVYYMVVRGIKQLIDSLTVGFQPAFGNMLAKKEMNTLNSFFNKAESGMHILSTIIFGCTMVLIEPFVMVYTSGVNDVNYSAPLFSMILVLAQAVYCIRLPYSVMILAAGHYKQTQNSAIVEVVLNIVISIGVVSKYGLVGVAVGTLIAMLYRTIYFILYLDKHVLYHNKWIAFKHLFIDAICILMILIISSCFKDDVASYFEWFILAIKVGLVSLGVTLIIRFIFDNKMMKKILSKKA